MTYRKKLIEVALPLEAINAASAREKSIRHGHPSTLHLWWARRPLAACRAVIFSSLVDDPDDPDAPPEFVEACRKLPRGKNAAANDTPRQRLFDFIETLVQWESTTDEQVLETARRLIRLATGGEPPPLLDPFAGGGSIPLEAQRLGLEAHASDLNPVAVMICKALIEIPPKFADRPPVNPRDRQGTAGDAGWKGAAGLAADVRYYGEWMRERAWERIGHLYPDCNGETVIAWIWARTVRSPNPAVDVHVPLIKKFDLSTKKGKRVWVEPIIDQNNRAISFEIRRGKRTGPKGTINRNGARCIFSDSPISLDYIRSEARAGRMGAMLVAVIAEGKSGRSYYAPNPDHEETANIKDVDLFSTELPERALGFRIQNYGMTKHQDLFTSRQLLALKVFSELVREACELIRRNATEVGVPASDVSLDEGGDGAFAYAQAVSVYLAFAVSKAVNYWSSLCAWHTSAEKMMSTFGRQALSMTWDYTEANPFSSSSGNFMLGIAQAAKMLDNVPIDVRIGAALQQDVAQLESDSSVLFSTDPPYYDNIGYAALSDVFYVWLRRSLDQVYPSLFSTMLTPKSTELIAEPGRHKSKQKASEFFEQGLFQAFERIEQLASQKYPTSIYYAFKQTEIVLEGNSHSGWEVFLNGIIKAGFQVLGTWPIRTEQSSGLRIVGRNSLASSIVLICRPRPDDAPMTSRREFVNALRRELPAALREMQSGNIAPVDLAQASIGPGMAVYSRYSKVLEPNGDRLTVRTALQLINHELDAYLAEQEGYIDEDSRFAVAWFEQFGFQEGPFGQADVLARAKNTSVDGLAYAGILESGGGKVRLYHWSDLDPGWDPATDKRLAVWEATHHLIERLNVYGEEGAARLLAKMPSDLATEARQLAYRLYSICDRKGWAEQARDYNALVISWSTSQEQAREFKEQYQQGRML